MKYQSKYGYGEIDAQHYLAEMMCERLARKDGIKLPQKFWYIREWKRHFLQQMRAYKILRAAYSEEAIVATITDKKHSNVYSLSAKWILPTIQANDDNMRLKKEIKQDVPKQDVDIVEKPTFRRKQDKRFDF